MTTQQDYVVYKLKKADESLKAAEILLANGLAGEAISKLYYAVFNVANALLVKSNLAPKTHSGVKSLFHKEFILSGIIEYELGKLYDNLLARRFEADYESFALIDENDMPQYVSGVKKLIAKAKHIAGIN